MGSDFERVVLLAVVHEITHPVDHVFEDRGPGEEEEAVLRRDERDDVEAGDNSGNLADESEDFEEVHAPEAVSTGRVSKSSCLGYLFRMIHFLKKRQVVGADIRTCWKFFSDPHNLAMITPPNLDFHVLSELPDEIYEGMMVEYRVRPLLGIPMTWLTEISCVRAPHYFVDEQRVGPYAVWHHEHEFSEMDDGRTEMIDRVHYVLPLSPISEVILSLMVSPQLEAIFDYRIQAVEKIFGADTSIPRSRETR